MDLLFKRYASPFILMNQYIRRGRLLKFINDLIVMHNEDEIYTIWIHKVNDKSYQEFKNEIEARIESENFTKEKRDETISKSRNILNNFNLEGGE